MEDVSSRNERRQSIRELSERYGTQYVQRYARRIAKTVAVHYGYATSDTDDVLTVRVYNRSTNTMDVVALVDVLSLIPVQPAELRTTEFGQVVLSDTVYLSTSIYACITAVLTSIGTIRGT